MGPGWLRAGGLLEEWDFSSLKGGAYKGDEETFWDGPRQGGRWMLRTSRKSHLKRAHKQKSLLRGKWEASEELGTPARLAFWFVCLFVCFASLFLMMCMCRFPQKSDTLDLWVVTPFEFE